MPRTIRFVADSGSIRHHRDEERERKRKLTPAVCFGGVKNQVKSSIEEVVARQGCVIAITDENNHELDHLAEHVIRVPQVNEFVSPLITCVPLQLLAYYIAARRGCPIDQPRNLAKSVTVE